MSGRHSSQKISAGLGTLSLCVFAVLAVLVFVDRTTSVRLPLPSVWYESRSLHLLMVLGSLGCGIALLWISRREEDIPNEPIFRRVIVYTRHPCPLCDRAGEILRQHSDVLPRVEWVDVDDEPLLQEKFGDSVPVVEFDGRVRFRGHVDPLLLARLIVGQRRQQELGILEETAVGNSVMDNSGGKSNG